MPWYMPTPLFSKEKGLNNYQKFWTTIYPSITLLDIRVQVICLIEKSGQHPVSRGLAINSMII